MDATVKKDSHEIKNTNNKNDHLAEKRELVNKLMDFLGLETNHEVSEKRVVSKETKKVVGNDNGHDSPWGNSGSLRGKKEIGAEALKKLEDILNKLT